MEVVLSSTGKKKIALFWAIHRPDRSPSQRFRFEQYLGYLADHGYQPEFSYLISAEDDKVFYKPGHYWKKFLILLRSAAKRFKEIRSAKKYSIVLVQRESFMFGTTYFERKMSQRVPMIFDFDDSIWLQNVSEANKNLAWLKRPTKTADLISLSKLVFAGNQYLKEYAQQFNQAIEIIPTTIDTEEYAQKDLDAIPEQVCIGWSGSITTIQHFEHALGFLRQLKAKYGDRICIQVIGDANYSMDELGITGIGWNKVTELDDLRKIDIGIMPLPDDEWSKGKCGLKGLQYMALGIPTIMSPVGVNSEIIQHGENGYLATTDQEWVDVISPLIEDPALRKRIGTNGRQTVVDKYSVIALQSRYLELFDSLSD